MNLVLILVYGVLIFLGTVVASIPFGFAQGFRQARGSPLSGGAQAILKSFEYLVETCAVVLVTVHMYGQLSQEPLLNGVCAFVVASLIAYYLEVHRLHEPMKTFVVRTLFALLFCLPLGLYLGSAVYDGS